MMPVSEAYKILDNPYEVQVFRNPDPYHNYDIVTLKYPGIEFIYFDFTDNPVSGAYT